MLVKELLKVYIFTTVFSDRYAISKINGFKFHCPCMKYSASILFIFFFNILLLCIHVFPIQTGFVFNMVYIDCYGDGTHCNSYMIHVTRVQEKPSKIVIRNNLLKAWSFWSPRMLKESMYTLHSTWILTSRRFPIAGGL